MGRSTTWLVLILSVMGALVWLLVASSSAMQIQAPARSAASGSVSGFVVDLDGNPVAGAVVRQRTTTNATLSGPDGSFTLTGLVEGETFVATAWSEGYIHGGAWVTPTQAGVTIPLKLHYTTDNADYDWNPSSDPAETISCMHCMVAHPQWQVNAHGTSATNPRFFSVYNGSDISGTGIVSPGVKQDLNAEGNCAACHAPIAVTQGIATPLEVPDTITGTYVVDMNELTGVEQEGSNCEFCHKIGNVFLDPGTGLPYDNAPGVYSMRLYRSPPGEVLWFGPFDDVWRRVSFLPLEKQSQFCAPCHQASFFGTPIYQSFEEWLNSPYPGQGIECQTCHMVPTGVDHFAKPERDGLIRDPDLIASHLQPGASDEQLLQNTVSMTLTARQVENRIQVTVTITNTNAGHHVPTDHPGRHMLLLVSGADPRGDTLDRRSGPTVPDWGGMQGGLPGKAFAKVLQDVGTGEAPVISYWKPTTISSDNRIPAMGSDTSTYTFVSPASGGTVTITAELRFRRLFQDVMEAKGWSTPDIVMEVREIELVTDPGPRVFLPMVHRGE